jgi:hypothetical protein
MKRKPVSTRTRFEIFKRDNFTCQYCGRKPPEIILEIDHITPVSKSGDEDPINLLTACFDCNRGKSNIEIKNKKERPDLKQINEENLEREIQLKEYYKYLSVKHKKQQKDMNEIIEYWEIINGNQWTINPSGRQSIKRFLDHLPKQEIIDAIEISTCIETVYVSDIERRWKYFCGVCWHKMKDN